MFFLTKAIANCFFGERSILSLAASDFEMQEDTSNGRKSFYNWYCAPIA